MSRYPSYGSFRLFVASFVLGSGCLYGQTPLFWGPNGSGNPAGGLGVWNLSSANWAFNEGGGYRTWPAPDGTSYRAVFGGTGDVVTVAGAISAAALRFEANGYTLNVSGGTNSLLLQDASGFAPRIDVPKAGHSVTIAGPVSAPNGLAVGGRGTVVLAGTNAISSSFFGLNIACATVKLMSATGSLDSSNNLWLGDGTGDNGGGGGGTFILDNTGATGTTGQTLATLHLTAGDGVVQTNRVAAQNLSLVFDSRNRVAGATVNYVVNGGVNGTENKINLTSQSNGFIDQGSFFGGSNYAWKDGGGFIRAINYGVDSGAVTTAGAATITGTHVQITGAITAQATATLSTLKISGANNFTLTGGATVTVRGILKTGGTAAVISGGTSIKPDNTTRELIVGTETAADSLTINSVIANASGASALTKSGPGTLVLGASNTYTGSTYLNGGTLSVATLPTASGTASPVGTGNASGAALEFSGGTLQYTGATVSTTRKMDFRAGGGGVEVTQAGTTLTLNSAINGANSPDIDAMVKSGPGTLVLSGSGDNSGFNLAVNGGTVRLAKNSEIFVHAVSSLTVNNGGTVQLAGSGGDQIYDSTVTSINSGGTLDLNGTSEATLVVRGGGTITNNHATSDSTLTLGEASFGDDYGSFGGVISDGSGGHTVSLTKAGLNTQVLGGLSTYTGQTLVAGGTLLVNGSIAGSSFVTVSLGATLGGSGTVGNTTVEPGGILSPGSGAGVLTVNGGLSLQSGSTLHLELAGPARGAQYDGLDVSGAFTLDGTLEVAFINGFTPAGGQVFNLFDSSLPIGTLDSLVLPALSGGLTWNATNLYTTGELVVVPEPVTCGSLLAGFSLALTCRRWRRQV